MFDGCDGAGNFAGHKSLPASRALVVEEDAVARVQAVALAVIDRRPIGKNLRHAIGTAGPERRLLILRHLLRVAEHFAARSLIKTRADSGFANRFKDADRPDARSEEHTSELQS